LNPLGVLPAAVTENVVFSTWPGTSVSSGGLFSLSQEGIADDTGNGAIENNTDIGENPAEEEIGYSAEMMKELT